MHEALGTARRLLWGLTAVIVMIAGREAPAQLAHPPGPSPTRTESDASPASTPASPPPATGETTPEAREREGFLREAWRELPRPLAPIRRGWRPEEGPKLTEEGPKLGPEGAAEPPPETVAAPPRSAGSEVVVLAQFADHWREGAADVYLLRGNCRLVRGLEEVRCREMVLWRTPLGSGAEGGVRVLAYAEGNVELVQDGRREQRPSEWIELTAHPLVVRSEYDVTRRSTPPDDPLYKRALKQRGDHAAPVVAAEYAAAAPPRAPIPAPAGGPGAGGPPPPLAAPPAAAPVLTRHIAIYPRASGQSFSMQTYEETDLVPRQFVTSVTGGVRIVIDGVPINLNGQMFLTTLDLAADRAVIWTDSDRVQEFSTSFDLDEGRPFEVYLEGNIEVRQGANVIRASRAFYDVSEERGLFLDTELRGYVPELDTTVRLRAREIRQLSHERFQARNAWVSTSEMGVPGFRIEARDLFLERRPIPGYTRVNPQTGEIEGGLLWLTSANNFLYLENVPIGYFPYISSPAEDPQIPLRNVNFGYNRVFGAEVRTRWDPEALFGLQLPDGLDWDVRVDYLSERGPAAGTSARYHGGLNLFGMPVRSSGEGDAYYIYDTGRDWLGAGRINLIPETEHRGRIVGRNRLDFPNNLWLITEIGYLTDRNVREQYWERDWDQGKDYETLASLNYQFDNFTASGLVRQRLFDFENTTNWLPKLDGTILAQPIGETPLLWSTHSSVGYAHLRPATPPPDPVRDPFLPLPFFADRQGLVAMSRHELDLPVSLGPVNVVPYVLGEAAYWEEDLSGEGLGRLYGSAGVRGSVMFSKYLPHVFSPIFGLNGLAHKMVFDADYSISESTTDLSRIPQYNEFDEDAQERFRSRFLPIEFGGVLPATFEPRFYAVRTGAGRWVTSPWHELVDDQHVVRLGWRHRLQTRVGTPQRPRIYDWMTLDLEASVFPDAARDNFGETLGLISARYAWNVGPRTSFLANTTFDVFDPGQQVWNVGVLSARTDRGSLYLGFRGIHAGPIDTGLIVASLSYNPSEKWRCTFGTSYDVVEQIDRGQAATVTRIGEYLLWTVGAGYDRSRNAWSVNFSLEPKFGNVRIRSTQLSSLQGLTQ